MSERSEDMEELHRQLRTGLAEFGKQWREHTMPALTNLFNTIGQALTPAIESTLVIVERIGDALHTAYVEDGAIYGDTQEGLQRWLRECTEINRLRMQADRLEQHQAMVRDFKRSLAQKAISSPSEESEKLTYDDE